MPSPSPYALLGWLGRRQTINRIRSFLSKPRAWAAVITMLAYFVFSAWLLVAVGGGSSRRALPSQVEIASAAGWLVITFGYGGGFGAMVGRVLLRDSDPFVLAVYASPIEPRAITRYRVTWLAALIIGGSALAAAAGGLFVSTLVLVSALDLTLRIWALLAPVCLVWSMVGLLLGAAASRFGPRVDDAVVTTLGVGILAFGAGILASGTAALPRLAGLANALAGPDIRWTLGLSDDPVTLLSVLLPWVGALALLAVAVHVPYPTPGVLGGSGRDRGALSPGQAPTDDFFSRLRRRLRFRYRDYGTGALALNGETVTLSLRSGDYSLGGMVVGLLVLFLAILTGTGGRHTLFELTAPVLVIGIWVGLFAILFVGVSYRSPLAVQLRQLPVSARDALRGRFAPRKAMIAILATLVAVSLGLGQRDLLLGLLAGTLTGSVLYLGALVADWPAPYYPLSDGAEGTVDVGPQLAMLAGLAVLLFGESLLGLFLPSPDPWDPLWLPLGISSVLNVFLIWHLQPVVGRRLVAPSWAG